MGARRDSATNNVQPYSSLGSEVVHGDVAFSLPKRLPFRGIAVVPTNFPVYNPLL